jgi:radical SAM protein with 4Fe4S-binding SPASM domain
MLSARPHGLARVVCPTEVALHRALQFLVADGKPYRCQAGDSLIAVLPNGDLVPCRRMPVVVGNLLRAPLRDLYDQSPFLRALRDPERVSVGCEGCFYARLCRGGLKCLSYALFGDPFQADPGCWRRDVATTLDVSGRVAPGAKE